MQKTKGAEIGAVFGSGAAAAVLGAGAANIITKITYWLGGIFLALVFALTIIHHKIVKSQTVIHSIPEATQHVPVKEEEKGTTGNTEKVKQVEEKQPEK